jgi:hypothetical protein
VIFVVAACLASCVVVVAWVLVAAQLRLAKPARPARALRWFHELRPFYLASVVTFYLTSAYLLGEPAYPLLLFGFVADLLAWWLFKDVDKDDDRWKRRRRKLTEKIQRSGSRLVVVPEGGA